MKSYKDLLQYTYWYICAISLAAAPLAPPTQTEITAFNSRLVSLQWQPPALEMTNGLIRYYTILVTEEDTNTMFTLQSNGTSALVKNLHPYFTYRFRVRAETIEPGPYSQPISRQLNEEGTSLRSDNSAT